MKIRKIKMGSPIGEMDILRREDGMMAVIKTKNVATNLSIAS